MSIEILEDLIEDLKAGEKDNFSLVLDQVVYYGFADDISLTKLFNMEVCDLEDLFDSDYELSESDYKTYRIKLLNYLKRERTAYSRILYRDIE